MPSDERAVLLIVARRALREVLDVSMIVAFLPGFSRSSAVHLPWKALLEPADVRFFDLPGHASEPQLPEATLEKLADHFAARIPPGSLIIGESLGGLIGLAMEPRGYHVAAFDPLFSTAKQWLLHREIRGMVARNPQAAWLPGFAASLFGIMPDGRNEERNYWPLLEGLTSPVHIVAASDPLWPIRPLTAPAGVLDEIDGYHLSRHPMVKFQVIEGPHTLLSESIEPAKAILAAVLDELTAIDPGRART
jgi:hypothetical protein